MQIVVIGAVWVLLLALTVPFFVMYQTRWSPQARLKRRAAAFVGDAQRPRDTGEVEAGTRRKLIQGKLKELESQRARNRRDSLRHLLLQSGLPLTMRAYVLGGIGCGIAVGLLLMALKLAPPVALAGAVGGGLGVPRFGLRLVIRHRQGRFTEHFADALDILVRGTRSGLPVAECLRIIGREMPDPVGYEFRTLVESQRIGMTLDQALERALERMPTTELQFFSIVLLIQQQTGGNLAATLENLSGVLRARKRLKDKIVAMSSEAKASAMIIGSLPFFVGIMIWLINPDYIELLFNTRTGHFLITAGLGWMAIGVLVMRQMINFDF